MKKIYGKDVLRLLDEVAVRVLVDTTAENGEGSEEGGRNPERGESEIWGVITSKEKLGNKYTIRFSTTGETELRDIMLAGEADIRKLTTTEIEEKRRGTTNTNRFDGDDMDIDKGKATRFYFQHADGLTEQALTCEWGGVMRQYQVDGAFLTDTRATEKNENMLKYGITRHVDDISVRHCHMKTGGVGGCTRALKQGLLKRIGNPKQGGKAIFEDEIGGLCTAVKFLGKKKDGVAPTALIISICTPLPGSNSKAGLFESLQKKIGEDPITNMIDNVAKLLEKETDASTMVIIHGDWNIHMAGPLSTAQKAQNRDEYKAKWMKDVITPFNLKNAYTARHDRPTTTYRTATGKGWIDHVYVSARALDKDDPYITGIGVGNQWEKTETSPGLLNSCHLPTLMDVELERWLHMEWNNDQPDTEKFTPTLRSSNKKNATKYHEALDNITMLTLQDGTQITTEQALRELEENIEVARNKTEASETPERINNISHAIQKTMVETEQALISDALRKRKRARNFRQIWTPEEAKRAYTLAQVKRVIGLARKKKWKPKEIWRNLTNEMIQVLAGLDLNIPSNMSSQKWSQWRTSANEAITILQKEQHTRARKLSNKYRKEFSTKLEESRKLRITKRYIDVALKRNNAKSLPQQLTYEKGKETVILDEAQEIKEVLTDITRRELGEGKTRFHTGEGDRSTDHEVTREDEQGQKLRRLLAYGKKEERERIKRTLPEPFHDTIDEMEMKEGATRRTAGHHLKLINVPTWKNKIASKKSGTRPGPGNLTIDMLKAANEVFHDLTRAIANTSIAHRMPMEDWKHSWCYKLPKTEGTPKAEKLRPLRFLNVLRKITLACVKDNMVRDWEEQGILPRDQYAFLPNKSTVPAALMRRMILEDAMANNKQMYSIDIDLSGGYDRIQRWVLHSALMRFGTDDSTIDYILNMAKNCTIGVLTAHGEGESFAPEAGALAQGDDTSCALWVCLTDWWLQTMERKNTNPYKYEIGPNETVDMFACIYADDGTWVQTDRKAAETCMQAANNFCEFTGQQISAPKSHALAIEWTGKKAYPTPTTPMKVKQWRAKGNAKKNTAEAKDKREPTSTQHKQWTLYLDEEDSVKWKPTSEHIRHLGNTQNALGDHDEMLEQMQDDMKTAAMALSRKVVKATGALQIEKIVLTPKMKYKMVLSNTTEAEINKVQAILKNQLCRKYVLCRTTRNAALWGNINGMGWNKWWHTVNIERAKIMASALGAEGTVIHYLMRGAIHRLKRSTGETGDVMRTLRPVANTERKIKKEWAYQLYEWMRKNNFKMRSEMAPTQPHRTNDQILVELASTDTERSLICRYQQANKLSDIIGEDGRTLTMGSPMANDVEWIGLIKEKLKVRKNKIPEDQELKGWNISTTEQKAKHIQRIGWATEDESGTLWEIGADGWSTKYERKGETSEAWIKTDTRKRTTYENMSPCITMRTHREATVGKTEGYKGGISRTCMATECLDRYKERTLKTEEDGGDVADITGWTRSKSNQISFTATWRKDKMEMNYTKVYVDNDMEEAGVKKPCESQTLTKCRTCHAAVCDGCTAEQREREGWTTAKRTNGQVQYGYPICGHCNEKAKEQQTKDNTRTVVQALARPIKYEMKTTTTTERRPHNWEKNAPNASTNIHKASKQRIPMCRIYSDGSAKHTEGAYGWLVEVSLNGKWVEVARGGGVEKRNTNNTRKISSGRMEALGVLRAKQYMQRRWDKGVEIRLDNLSVVNRHNRMWQQQKKRWNDTDNDIWDQMRRTRTRNAIAIHVYGHQDTLKKGKPLDEHERKNVEVDKIAGEMYKKAKEMESKGQKGDYYEREDATNLHRQMGDCSIGGHDILGDNTKTVMTHLGTEEALNYWLLAEGLGQIQSQPLQGGRDTRD